MSTKLVDKLEKILNEEKWTRATINNYTVNNFEEFNKLLEEFKIDNTYSSMKDITDEYLKHNKNSIVALYISSMIDLENNENITENNNIYALIKIFSDNLKWNIVEYLAKKVLDHIEDKFVLKTLIKTNNNLNKKDNLPELWERLIKVDYEEADAVVNLANHKESQGEIDEAIVYFKKAINRYIMSKSFVQVEEIWKKLLTYEDIGYDYFTNLDIKISKSFSVERSIELLKLLFEKYKSKNEYDICIIILKDILEKSSKDEYSRREIIDVYKEKYKDHSHLEEYVKISNLEGSWRNIHDAIDSFEKHIAFDKNNFVYHRTWGLGRIAEVSKDIFSINFQSKKEHKMSLKMALNSLQILSKNHIWLLKLKNMDLLKKKIRDDIPWALKILILSYDNRASLKEFKEELVPDILTESQWNSWWTAARKVLKTDPKFGAVEGTSNVFEVREKPLSFEEKTYNSFKAAKDFTQRLNLILDYLENTDPDPDYLEEMVSYFGTFLNSVNSVNEQTICSYLLVKSVTSKYSFIKQNIPYEFSEYFDELEDPVGTYQKLFTSDFKKDYLLFIKNKVMEWEEIYVRIFYIYPNKMIFDELSNKDFSLIEKLIRDLNARYKEFTEAYFWIITNIMNEKMKDKLNIDSDNIIFSLIHLIEIATKNIGLKKDLVNNKKILKQLKDYLFKNNLLFKHIKKANKDFSKRLFTILDELVSIDGENVIKIKNIISEKYPDIDTDKALKYDVTITKSDMTEKLLTTEKSYEDMQQKMLSLKDVEIPQNSSEIGWAMEKGDLRENAEYKAAKEQQSFLQNKLNKLVSDLSIAQIIKKEDIHAKSVTFGTKVTMENKLNNKTIQYTILGPMESETSKNIISYQSPLGINLIDKKKNDEVKFTLNKTEYVYLIKDIEVADF